jgi:hypothetical protein
MERLAMRRRRGKAARRPEFARPRVATIGLRGSSCAAIAERDVPSPPPFQETRHTMNNPKTMRGVNPESGKVGMAILLWILGVPGSIVLLYVLFAH